MRMNADTAWSLMKGSIQQRLSLLKLGDFGTFHLESTGPAINYLLNATLPPTQPDVRPVCVDPHCTDHFAEDIEVRPIREDGTVQFEGILILGPSELWCFIVYEYE